MSYLFKNLKFSTTAIAVILCSIFPNSVEAATITYSLSGTTDSGSLINENYTGTFSFDDTNLIGSNRESLALSTITFDFLGTTFTEIDATATPTVNFLNGELLGLSYSLNNFETTFSLVPGFFNLNSSYFSYQPNTGNAGFGNINYEVVPEPLTILGATTALIFGSFFKVKLR